MINQKKICKSCLTEQFIWNGGNCKSCSSKINPQKSIKKSYLSKHPSLKQIEKKAIKKEWLEELHSWEFSLFDKQKDENGYCYCFETGTPMHESTYQRNLCVYSHILPKGVIKYKKYAMEEWNVKIVLPDWHTLFENRSEKAKNQLKLEKELKLLYG